MADDDVETPVTADLSAEKAQEAKQLDAITDYQDEREIDTKKAQEALHSLTAASGKSAAATAREAELAKIKVKDEDVQFVMSQLECSEDEATLKLRHNQNSIQAVLKQAIDA